MATIHIHFAKDSGLQARLDSSKVYNAGFRACKEGIPYTKNPVSNPQFKADWERGWKAAEKYYGKH